MSLCICQVQFETQMGAGSLDGAATLLSLYIQEVRWSLVVLEPHGFRGASILYFRPLQMSQICQNSSLKP